MSNIRNHKPYDDDDDDYINSSNEENNYEENVIDKPEKKEKMKDWEKPNWFITLCINEKQKCHINIANVTEISFGSETVETWYERDGRNLYPKEEIWVHKDFEIVRNKVPKDYMFVSKNSETEDYLTRSSKTIDYLYIYTNIRCYICQIDQQQVKRYSEWLDHNNFNELYLNPIVCNNIKICTL